MTKEVIIIGGGVAGLGCAITLGSAQGKNFEKMDVLVLDAGKSDLHQAELHNVPFIQKGLSGSEALEEMKKDANRFGNVEILDSLVSEISGDEGNFVVKSDKGEFKAKYLVIATGAKENGILLNGKAIPSLAHDLCPKPNLIKAASLKARGELSSGIYVAGLFAGVTTMYATALGSGVEAASAILSKIAGKVSVIHDFKGSRS